MSLQPAMGYGDRIHLPEQLLVDASTFQSVQKDKQAGSPERTTQCQEALQKIIPRQPSYTVCAATWTADATLPDCYRQCSGSYAGPVIRGSQEKKVYYVSKKFNACELNYTALEKTCAAWDKAEVQALHYMLAHSIKLVLSMNLLKYLFEKPALYNRMAKCLLMLSEFEITYVTFLYSIMHS